MAFECMFTEQPFTLDNGLLGNSHTASPLGSSSACQHLLLSAVPAENVATVAACASVVEGVSRSRNALLNGDTRNYDWDSGYTCHQLGSGAIVIQLAQPFSISSLRYASRERCCLGCISCLPPVAADVMVDSSSAQVAAVGLRRALLQLLRRSVDQSAAVDQGSGPHQGVVQVGVRLLRSFFRLQETACDS